ncbi:DNA mismatch repair protein MSH6, putative [Plasmodium sp. gorilla clade G2]|uniref:DNA mismatch repair protein MSH6, putative n=1 Tax=Plasmodium sp. gorilla clade G2 TaxID=880535 RepID=UPI000D207D41|nr:DNA mismatch repair protein MSH6, putative [Plasmodium sp. gorilla clade G2]SOV11574.1 DNA mismatch repair protein MSH6, putative [Plasmodium sp. gorilla clade G2]
MVDLKRDNTTASSNKKQSSILSFFKCNEEKTNKASSLIETNNKANEKEKSIEEKNRMNSKNKSEKEILGGNKKINVLDMFLSKGEMPNNTKIIDNINKEAINGDISCTNKNMNVNESDKMNNLFLDEENIERSRRNSCDSNVHNNNICDYICRNDSCDMKTNDCNNNNNNVEGLDEESNYQNMVHNKMLEGKNYLDNIESSTEDDIIIKKKRKIILDSASENECVEEKNNNINKNNVSVDNKLTNLLYEPNKEIDNNLLLLDNNINNIKKCIEKRKGDDSKKSQELDSLRNKYLNLPISITNDKFRLYIEHYFLYCNTFEFPKWIQPQYIRDINLRNPDHPDYDSTTIWTPPPDHKWAIEYKQAHYTPGMQQFWKIKSKNFDKIIFFKMGRFYEIFYIDACLMHTICSLNWMSGEHKPHLGFPEQSLHFYAKKVINSGHKVVVIEQMETPKELEQRNKESIGPKDKAIKREINEIYTKGTILHDNMLSAETKYLVCFFFDEIEDVTNDDNIKGDNNMKGDDNMKGGDNMKDDNNMKDNDNMKDYNNNNNNSSYNISPYDIKNKCNFGFVISDIATSYIAVGYCNDDESRIVLRTILAQLCPAEILYCSKNINKEVLSIFKNIPTSPELTCLNNFPNIISSFDEINKYFENIPPNLDIYKEQSSVICAFGGFIVYLRSLLLDKKIFRFCKIENYDLFKRENYMVLDATALKHLEILETQSGDTKNSLYDYVNKTCTNFGARNLRRWICSPLLDCEKIKERLDVVDFLKNNEQVLSLIRLKLRKLPDIERLLNKICIQASQSERGAVFFDNIVNTKLKEFVTFLNAFKEIDSMLIDVNRMERDGDLPSRLFQICNTPDTYKDNIKGSYPNIGLITNEFLEKIYFDGDKEYKPAEGCDEDIDKINEKEKNVEHKLNNVLEHMRTQLKISTLKFVHAKFKYEVECPDNIPKSFLKNVEITSAKKGYVRIHNDEIKSLVEKLEDIEQEKKDAIYPFFQKLFHLFYAHYEKYVSACRLIAELDCLQSFAYVVLNTSFPLTRPILHPMDSKKGEEKTPFLILEDNIHPVVAMLMPNFISNNIYMGCDKENQSTLLLTGPNMGGKSTLLRQTAISVILAQIGAFVPCTYCELTIVDKIFTRLGSSDNLFEGKSTFLVELEDISNLLKQSTKYSLAILDELGRGTSSFDGTAIALSTLEQISDVIKCRCIFSTHYHLLVEEVKHNKNISNYHMSLSIDDEQEKIIFLYKFIKGVCPKSFGIHIAKLAGLPKEIIDLAHEKSLLFENVTDEFCKIIKYKNITRSLLNQDADEKLVTIFHKYKKEFA